MILNHGQLLMYDDDASPCICEEYEGVVCTFDFETRCPSDFDYESNTICECGVVNCEEVYNKHRTKKHLAAHEIHAITTRAIVYETHPHKNPWQLLAEGACMEIEHCWLSALPSGFELPQAPAPSRRSGYIYMVASQPDLSLHRMKCGYTKNIQQRLDSYRTFCPRSLLLGLWEADECDESWLFHFIDPPEPIVDGLGVSVRGSSKPRRGFRFKTSEEFDIFEPFETIMAVAMELSLHQASDGRNVDRALPSQWP